MKESSYKILLSLIVKFSAKSKPRTTPSKDKNCYLRENISFTRTKLTLETATSQYLSQRTFSATIIPLAKCHSTGESKLFETLMVF